MRTKHYITYSQQMSVSPSNLLKPLLRIWPSHSYRLMQPPASALHDTSTHTRHHTARLDRTGPSSSSLTLSSGFKWHWVDVGIMHADVCFLFCVWFLSGALQLRAQVIQTCSQIRWVHLHIHIQLLAKQSQTRRCTVHYTQTDWLSIWHNPWELNSKTNDDFILSEL